MLLAHVHGSLCMCNTIILCECYDLYQSIFCYHSQCRFVVYLFCMVSTCFPEPRLVHRYDCVEEWRLTTRRMVSKSQEDRPPLVLVLTRRRFVGRSPFSPSLQCTLCPVVAMITTIMEQDLVTKIIASLS